MVRFRYVSVAVGLLFGASGASRDALAQGQELAPIKVNLPPSPSFDQGNVPERYPSGEVSVHGLRKKVSRYLDKDVRVKGYLVAVYECPAELKACNDTKNKKKATTAVAALPGGCRPCDQPHFFVGDAPDTKLKRALLVADYPVKDWETGRPKPLAAKAGDQVVVTGTFAINSITGFAASNGLIIHKRLEDAAGKILAEGNAVLPPEAQSIQLEGRPPEPLKLPKR